MNDLTHLQSCMSASGVAHFGLRLGGALLLLVCATPTVLHAQFLEPTPEELKMTADPKAPGAAAVYLYREEICNAELQTYSYYERIKVLTDKGKEMATISLPYEQGTEKVTDVKGRTIHADGSIVALTATPEDMMDFKAKKYQENTIVFTLPSVEVGSILEYRVTLRFNESMPLPTWNIQQHEFVHKAHYSLHYTLYGFSFLMYSSKIGSGAKVDNKMDDYTLDLDDIPPLPDEDWMPPLNTIIWRVEFYLSGFKSGKEFWDYATKSWAKAVNEFTNPNGFLKKTVAQIVAPADSEEQKARKIYAAVQKLDNTSFSRQKSRAERKKEKIKDIHNAGDVWKQQSGYDDNIALLYVALARAAGLKAWPMKVVDRNRAIFDPNFLSTYQMDDYLAIVELNGKDVYLDPGQKMCPFGSLHWKHNLVLGFKLTEKGAIIAATPASTYEESAVLPSADLIIDLDGGMKGTVRVVMNGPEALYWRQLALVNDETEVRKQFIESMRNDLPEGVQADFDRFLSLEDPTVNLIAFVNVSGSLGSVTGKHLFLPGLFFKSRAKHPFVAQDKRITPIDLHYAKMEQEDVVYHLPAGYTVESAPKIPDLAWPNHALLRMNSTIKDSTVEVQRTFTRYFTMLRSGDYNDLHDFYLKIATADQQPLVLTRTPVAKGN